MGAIVPKAEKINQVRTLLQRMEPQLKLALPRHLDAGRMLRIAMTEIQRTPKLLDCDQRSLLGALLTSCQLGLEPGVQGHSYLVPFGKEVQLIIGYRGLLDLCRRSGQVGPVSADVVQIGDLFEFEAGTAPRIKHIPAYLCQPPVDRGENVCVYACATLKDGGVQAEVMSIAEVEAIRARSRAGQSGPWVTDWDEMAKKTVFRRLAKWLPTSIELQRAVTLDEMAEREIPQHLEAELPAIEDEAPEPEKENPEA